MPNMAVLQSAAHLTSGKNFALGNTSARVKFRPAGSLSEYTGGGAMQNHTGQADDFSVLRERLANRYRVQSEYIGAPMLAAILGIGRTTIHDQIQEKRFAIPHRLLNRKTLFLFDDVVAWILGQPRTSVAGDQSSLSRAAARQFAEDTDPLVDEAVRETCAALGIVRQVRGSAKL
jgi:predicted DNA-binding transcriptional regulator AlpA